MNFDIKLLMKLTKAVLVRNAKLQSLSPEGTKLDIATRLSLNKPPQARDRRNNTLYNSNKRRLSI